METRTAPASAADLPAAHDEPWSGPLRYTPHADERQRASHGHLAVARTRADGTHDWSLTDLARLRPAAHGQADSIEQAMAAADDALRARTAVLF